MSTDDIDREAPSGLPGNPSGDDATLQADERVIPERRRRSLQHGDRLGRYTVLEELGRGAMGLVFAAFDPALDRRIALKVVARSDDAVHRARLVREAQAMAKLSHRNVVAVHDVGEAQTGNADDPPVVYIAMEFIRGGTLRQWLATERPWPDVLRMFIGCARGLAAAHLAGLVHADFKPDNVLVDDEGLPRVADFGLVTHSVGRASTDERPRDVESGEATAEVPLDLTASQAVMGTPAYMAPELFDGQRADPRADQFALCVGLFEALWHTRPFVADNVVELVSTIRGGVVSFPDKGKVPTEIRRIVARGLSADPDARWPSIAALADALEDTLRAPDVPRWKLASAGTAALAVAVAIAWPRGGDTPQCDDGAAAITEVWHPARRGALEKTFVASGTPYASTLAHSVNDEIDRRTTAWVKQYDDACAATRIRNEQSEAMLDRRMMCLQRRRLELDRWIDAIAVADAAALDRAASGLETLPSPERCAESDLSHDAASPPADPTRRSEYDAIEGELARVTALAAAGDRRGALAQAEPLVARAEQLGHDPTTAEVLLIRSAMRRDVGPPDATDSGAADALSALVLARRRDLEPLAVRANLALAFDRIRSTDPTRAQEYLQIANAGIDRLDGNLDLTRQAARYEGFLRRIEGRFDASLEAHRKEIAIAEAQGSRPVALAAALASAADCQVRLGRFDEAEPLYRRALDLQRKLLGDDHPAVATSLSNLGLAYREAKQPEAAQRLLEQALEIHRKSRGLEHNDAIDTVANLAIVHGDLDDKDAWIAGLEQVLALRSKIVGPGHDNLVIAHNDLGNAYLSVARLTEARTHYEAALTELDHGLGRGHSLAAYPLTGLAYVAKDLGDLAGALARHREALAVRDATATSAPALSLDNLLPIVELAERLGDAELAKTSRARTSEIMAQLPVDDPRRIAWLARPTPG